MRLDLAEALAKHPTDAAATKALAMTLVKRHNGAEEVGPVLAALGHASHKHPMLVVEVCQILRPEPLVQS